MSDIKIKVQGVNPNAEARDLTELVDTTGNIYEALAVISARAARLQVDLKQEIGGKMEQFVEEGENLQEVNENKEQIDLSRSYERLPNPAIIATQEFLAGDLHAEYRSDREVGDF